MSNSGATTVFGNWGTRATASTSVTPATDDMSNLAIVLQENSYIHFYITDADAATLKNTYNDLNVVIGVYRTGENTEVW